MEKAKVDPMQKTLHGLRIRKYLLNSTTLWTNSKQFLEIQGFYSSKTPLRLQEKIFARKSSSHGCAITTHKT